MIEFTCLCGNHFSLDLDMAGASFQCAKCARLVTVPTLDDLKNLDSDGTYTLGEHYQAAPAPGVHLSVASDAAMRISGKIDDIPMAEMIGAPDRVAPRYDPETGELIRAVEMQSHVISEAAKAAPRTQPVSKSSKRHLVDLPKLSPLDVLVELLRIKNLVVILIIGALHILLVGFAIMLDAGVFFGGIFAIFVLAPVLAQYSLIIQETGPAEKEELPPPMREFGLREDVWDPIVHLFLSALICFGPAAAWWYDTAPSVLNDQIALCLAVLGAVFFPVVMMTASIDGILANFRPDRLVGVIATAAFSYALVVVAFIAGTLIYVDGFFGQVRWGVMLFHHAQAGAPEPRPIYIPNAGVGFCMTLAGLYVLYFACWQLGLIWRAHHDQFPWVAQRFVKETPIKAPAKDSSAPR